MKATIGITEKNQLAVATELSRLLADEFVLYTKRATHIGILKALTFIACINFLKASMKRLMR